MTQGSEYNTLNMNNVEYRKDDIVHLLSVCKYFSLKI